MSDQDFFDPGVEPEPEEKKTTSRRGRPPKSDTPTPQRRARVSQHDRIHETLTMMQHMGLDTELKFLHLTKADIIYDEEKQVYTVIPPNQAPALTFSPAELHVISAALEDLLKTPAGDWIQKNIGGRGFSLNMFMALLIVSKHTTDMISLRSHVIHMEQMAEEYRVKQTTATEQTRETTSFDPSV